MAVKTQAIVEGYVQRIKERSGTTKDGRDWSRTEVTVIGDVCLANATLGDDIKGIGKGQYIRALIEIGVYRDDDSVVIVELLDEPVEPKK